MDNNNYNFDPMTGEPINNGEAPLYEAPQYNNTYEAYDSRSINNAAPESKAKSITGMCLAIAGLAFSWLGIYFGIFGIIPLGLCIVGLCITKRPPFTKPAKICGIIGIILTAIFIIIGIVILALFADGGYYFGEILEEIMYF